MGNHVKFRLFLVVIFAFIGAVIFISQPFMNNTKTTPVYDVNGNVVSVITDSTTVSIGDEEVAKGVPAASKADSKWGLIAIGVTIINVAGAVAIVIMTSRDTVQV